MEADATGAGEKVENFEGIGALREFSTTSFTSLNENGGTASWSFLSSSSHSGGRRSPLVDATWPSFINVGPSSSSTSRILTATDSSFFPAPEVKILLKKENTGNILSSDTSPPKPYLTRVVTILFNMSMFLIVTAIYFSELKAGLYLALFFKFFYLFLQQVNFFPGKPCHLFYYVQFVPCREVEFFRDFFGAAGDIFSQPFLAVLQCAEKLPYCLDAVLHKLVFKPFFRRKPLLFCLFAFFLPLFFQFFHKFPEFFFKPHAHKDCPVKKISHRYLLCF